MVDTHITQVRRFNRTVAQRIGALDDHFLGLDRPLSEARLLFEIGREGAEVRRLRGRLDLDSGYLSRLLRSLEGQGLVVVGPAADDGRVRHVRLTPAGQAEVAELDRRSDGVARSILAPLSRSQRDRLVAAMAEVDRLLEASCVTIEGEAPTTADARSCLDAYYRELDQRFDNGFDLTATVSPAADEMAPPTGAFLVARLHGRAIGCGGLKTTAPGVGLIKRMWVARPARGLGVGRRLLVALEHRARALGLRAVRLDTNRALDEAQALYRKHGYRQVAPFNDEPYSHLWFEKTLG